MLLTISDNKTIADLQDKFNECFPDLMIAFYHHPHHWKKLSAQTQQIDPAKKIEVVSAKHQNGLLEIKSWYQTGRVEKDFQRLFGLNVQIFGNEGGNWVQTASSDLLTLKEQQDIAAAAGAPPEMNMPSEDAE